MIKVENIEIWGFEHAIRGMRNPLASWDRSDSDYDARGDYLLGDKDIDLMRRLYKAGTEHRKYARQIFVSMDITAPLYWWKEADQYRINVTTNSCSTMHKIQAKEFALDDFSIENLDGEWLSTFDILLGDLENARKLFVETKDKKYWWQMIQLLPSSYNQRRTITMTYENVFSMIHQRENHKLDEWRDFVEILKTLPYIEEITNG